MKLIWIVMHVCMYADLLFLCVFWHKASCISLNKVHEQSLVEKKLTIQTKNNKLQCTVILFDRIDTLFNLCVFLA